jgi:hypothetical protein
MIITDRRGFMKVTAGAAVALSEVGRGVSFWGELPANKKLGCIQNNDVNNILYGCSGASITPDEYREAVGHLLDGKPRVLVSGGGVVGDLAEGRS